MCVIVIFPGGAPPGPPHAMHPAAAPLAARLPYCMHNISSRWAVAAFGGINTVFYICQQLLGIEGPCNRASCMPSCMLSTVHRQRMATPAFLRQFYSWNRSKPFSSRGPFAAYPTRGDFIASAAYTCPYSMLPRRAHNPGKKIYPGSSRPGIRNRLVC